MSDMTKAPWPLWTVVVTSKDSGARTTLGNVPAASSNMALSWAQSRMERRKRLGISVFKDWERLEYAVSPSATNKDG